MQRLSLTQTLTYTPTPPREEMHLTKNWLNNTNKKTYLIQTQSGDLNSDG